MTCDLPHESEQTALTSYHLKIYVREMSEGTVYYRGVTKCEATSTEEAGDDAFNNRETFTERITIILESGAPASRWRSRDTVIRLVLIVAMAVFSSL